MRRRLFTALSILSLVLCLAWLALVAFVFFVDPLGQASWQYHLERHRSIVARNAIALTALAVLPLLWIAARLRQRRRRTNGLCLCCGYNLTGNASGVCPECGTPTTAGAKA